MYKDTLGDLHQLLSVTTWPLWEDSKIRQSAFNDPSPGTHAASWRKCSYREVYDCSEVSVIVLVIKQTPS